MAETDGAEEGFAPVQYGGLDDDGELVFSCPEQVRDVKDMLDHHVLGPPDPSPVEPEIGDGIDPVEAQVIALASLHRRGGERLAVAPLEVFPLAGQVVVEADAGVFLQAGCHQVDVDIARYGRRDGAGLGRNGLRRRDRLFSLFPERQVPVTAVQAQDGSRYFGSGDPAVRGLPGAGLPGTRQDEGAKPDGR